METETLSSLTVPTSVTERTLYTKFNTFEKTPYQH